MVDTAGLEDTPPMASRATCCSRRNGPLADADVALLVFDARAGLTPMDRHFALTLRRLDTPLLLVGNKCEGRAADAGLLEAHELGLGEPLAISAEHGIGMAELAAALVPFDPAGRGVDGEAEDDPSERVIQLAIVWPSQRR